MSDDGEQRTFSVSGMTCAHCVAAVREEVSGLSGVSDVDVDLDSGALLVSGENIDGEAVRAAVEEAGYSLTAAA
jgi:copper ion binding protein